MSSTARPKPLNCRYQPKLILAGLIQFITLLALPSAFAQTKYYVSSAGNDQNNGTTPNTPFQSLSRVSNLYLQPGDSILFRRGDTLRGSLYIRQSGSASRPIVVDAYGSGQKPVLSGSVPLTNWSNIGGNVWQANCSSCGNSVTGLYRNGYSLPLGRYPNTDAPNKGNLYIRAHTDKYQIFSREAFPANIDFKGAEVVLRPTAWILDKAIVDQEYKPDVINIFYNSNYGLRDGGEFFFQNHPGTLDRNGEWCYNSATRNVLIYSDQGTPASQLLTATVHGRGVDMVNVSYIKFRNLHITQTLNTSFFAINTSHLTLTNLDITNSGEDGIYILGSGTNVLLENNRLITANNNGVLIDPSYQNVTLRDNTIRSVGIVPGRGKPGDGMYNGIQSEANQNILIENNVVDSIGYNGITFRSNTTIRQNIISNYCYSKLDGGGIYCHRGLNGPSMTNVKLESNILYTDPAGGNPWIDYSIGIFLDDCVENVEIKNNTIFGHTQWGVFLHATSRITFTDNTLFNNRSSQLVLYHNNGGCPMRGNVVKRNVLVSKYASQLVGQFESNANDLIQYGVIDSNYYARPFDEQATIQGYINSGQGGRYELKDWRNFSGGQDLNSKSSPITYKEYKSDVAGGVNRFSSPYDTGADGWYMVYSNYNNAEAVVDNTNKLDGNSLRVTFATPSGQPNSYAQAGIRFGTITKGKTYILRFDAVASTNVNVLAYLRTSGPPYQEYDRRYSVAIGTTRKSYEFLYTATESNPDAILLFQIDGEGPTFWLDNVRLQESDNQRNNPDDFIKFYYNPTRKDTVIALTGAYRDVKNQSYINSVTLKPFTSVVLLRDTLPVSPADLSLSLQSDKRVLQVNEPAAFQLRVSNQSNTPAALARWTYRLPANLQFVDNNGQLYGDNVLTGTVQQLAPLADTTFTFSIKPTAAGLFRTAAQITTATSPDFDSKPNTGLADGEDDVAKAELLVGGTTTSVFESPNINQRTLPPVASNQPVPNPTLADLSLRMEVSQRAPTPNEVVTCTLYVDNAGGLAADMVQIQNQLPDGFQLVSSTGWSVNGRLLSTTLPSVPAGATVSASFQVRVTLPGVWINRAQVSASSVADPDSTPGNGYTNGEDDRAQTDVRGN